MKNIELKVKVKIFAPIESKLKGIGAKRVGLLQQTDTYYRTKSGRLKMREINSKEFELIHYVRPDVSTHKVSQYQIVTFDKSNAKIMDMILKETLGVFVVIKKSRILWLFKNTRIHLDRVAGLGNYLELESVVKDDMNSARKEYDFLIAALRLNTYHKEKKSYSDLLFKKR